MVPSYSTGSFDFTENLKTCAAYDCTVVWINTCCALPTEKKQPDDFSGFVQISGKRTTIRNGQFRHCFSKCRKVHDGEACRTCIDTKKYILMHKLQIIIFAAPHA